MAVAGRSRLLRLRVRSYPLHGRLELVSQLRSQLGGDLESPFPGPCHGRPVFPRGRGKGGLATPCLGRFSGGGPGPPPFGGGGRAGPGLGFSPPPPMGGPPPPEKDEGTRLFSTRHG